MWGEERKRERKRARKREREREREREKRWSHHPAVCADEPIIEEIEPLHRSHACPRAGDGRAYVVTVKA